MRGQSAVHLRTCPYSTPRFAVGKSPTLQNPVEEATGVRHSRRGQKRSGLIDLRLVPFLPSSRDHVARLQYLDSAIRS